MWMTHNPCVPPDCKRLGSHEDISNVGFGKDPRSGQSCIVSLSTYLRRYLYYGSDGAKTKSKLTFFPHPGVVGLAQGTPEAHADTILLVETIIRGSHVGRERLDPVVYSVPRGPSRSVPTIRNSSVVHW